MKHFIRSLVLLMLTLALLPCAAAEDVEIGTLEPFALESSAQLLDLYCGPTQGSYRHDGQTLDTGKPFVVFGQYDCWAMAAQGTPQSFGPVGWVEAAALDALPYEPQLGFEDGFAATIEETALLTNDPLGNAPETVRTLTLEPGAQVIVLAKYGEWLYVQSELEGKPVRAFVSENCIF